MMYLIKRALKILFLCGFSVVVLMVLGLGIFIYDNYMFAWEAQIRWGNVQFDPVKFREISTNEKSEMVADLIKKKYFIGEPISNVAKILGNRTGGYYNHELNLTYLVWQHEQTAWEIVFIVDPDTKRVHSIRIYKRCCAITKRTFGFLFKIIGAIF